MLQLKGRISELEAELAEQQHLRQQAADDSEFLRAELDELKKKREDTEKAQRSLTEIERERTVGVGELRTEEEAGWQGPRQLVSPVGGQLGIWQMEHLCEARLRTWGWGLQKVTRARLPPPSGSLKEG